MKRYYAISLFLLILVIFSAIQTLAAVDRASATCVLTISQNSAGVCSTVAAALAVDGKLNLKQVLDIGLINSPRLKIAQAETDEAMADSKAAESLLRPGISLSGTVSNGNSPMFISTAPNVMPSNVIRLKDGTTTDVNLMLMTPIYTGGSLNNTVYARRIERFASLWAKEKARLELALELKIRYIETLFFMESRRTYEELLDLQSKNVIRSEMLYDAGKIPLVYLLRVKNEQAAARSMINNISASEETSRISLLALMGVEPSLTLKPCEPIIRWEFTTDKNEALQAIDKHPLLCRLQEKLNATRHELMAIAGEYLPQVYLYGMGETMAPSDMDRNPTYTVGIIASIAVADGGARKARTEKVIARIKALQAEKEEARLALSQDILAQYEAITAADKNIALADAVIIEAAEVLRISDLRYNSGKGIYLEIFDAEWNMAKARLMKLEAIKNYNIALARLQYAIGKI